MGTMPLLGAGLAGPASAAPSPPLTGLAAWYRADLGVTEAGTGVSQWNDQSGNGHHVVQATDANRPALVTGVINAHPVIRFTRANTDRLVDTSGLSISQPYTLVMVAARTATGGTQWVLSAGDGNYRCIGYDSDDTPQMFAGGIVDDAVPLNTAFHAFIGIFNGASSEIFIDNSSVVTGDAGSGSIGGVGIGVGNGTTGDPFGGDIAEVLIYDHALDGTERTALAAYVAARYAL
jgi:hypothetical protein